MSNSLNSNFSPTPVFDVKNLQILFYMYLYDWMQCAAAAYLADRIIAHMSSGTVCPTVSGDVFLFFSICGVFFIKTVNNLNKDNN